jgi:hypothetical protein
MTDPMDITEARGQLAEAEDALNPTIGDRNLADPRAWPI